MGWAKYAEDIQDAINERRYDNWFPTNRINVTKTSKQQNSQKTQAAIYTAKAKVSHY